MNKMESRNSSPPRMNFSCVSPCMKVKRHAKEYLRTDDDLTEVKVLRFGSLQSSDEQEAKTGGVGAKRKKKALARPLSNPRKPLVRIRFRKGTRSPSRPWSIPRNRSFRKANLRLTDKFSSLSACQTIFTWHDDEISITRCELVVIMVPLVSSTEPTFSR